MQRRIRRSARSPAINVSVKALGTRVQRSSTSKQIHKDHTQGILGGKTVLLPPYDIDSLIMMKERSNMLRQCIAAKVTNIGMSGWDIVRAHEDIPIDPAEKEELQSFIDSPNSEESLIVLHSKVVDDFDTVGFAFVEVIRNRAGALSILRHAKSSTTRLCPRSETKIPITYDVLRGPKVHHVIEYRTFRMYLQHEGGRTVYFKEFGDPRKLNARTGDFEDDGNKVSPEDEATELIHLRKYSDDEYGVPDWINQIPAILGSREAEEVNLRYFQDNTIPPILLSVAGGRLTAQSYQDLHKLLTGAGLGKERQHQIVLVEAVGESDTLDARGTPIKLQVDKLTDSRQSDGLFKEYDESNQAKIRSSFRLPPVAVGLSQDVTFATANVSMHIAETQVYSPERKVFDEAYNKNIVHSRNGLGLSTVALRSRSPLITSPETSIKTLTALNVMGAITPRSAQQAASSLMDIDLPQYPEKGEEGYEDWMDLPIAFALRKLAGAEKTHEEQKTKTDDIKETEETGDASFDRPEHGQE